MARSATTRAPRPGETELDYAFVSEEQFKKQAACGNFFEWSNIYSARYGKLWTELLPPLLRGRRVVIDLHPDTVHHYRRLPVPLMALYLEPPSLDCLSIRLGDRVAAAQCDKEQAHLRLAAAERELARLEEPGHLSLFDAVLVSGEGPGGAYQLDAVKGKVLELCSALRDSG